MKAAKSKSKKTQENKGVSYKSKRIKYEDIANVILLRPIRSEEQYNQVLYEIDKLIEEPEPSQEVLDYLDVLATLIQRYEQEHFPLETEEITPLEILKSFMEEHDMSGSDLGRLLGNRQLGNTILRGERSLSKAHIRILANHFKVSSQLFF